MWHSALADDWTQQLCVAGAVRSGGRGRGVWNRIAPLHPQLALLKQCGPAPAIWVWPATVR